MNLSQAMNLASAVFGAAGTMILFFSSYSLQPLEGGVFGGPALTEYNAKIQAKNARRLVLQRVGLALLCASFVVQAAVALA
jgi:hypothetical protein